MPHTSSWWALGKGVLFILGPMSGLNSDVFLKDIVQCATSTSVVWETRRRVWVSLTATSLPLITLDTTAKILQTLKAALITLDTTCATRAKGGKEYKTEVNDLNSM